MLCCACCAVHAVLQAVCAFLSLNVEEFAALSRNEVALKVGVGA